MAFDLGNFFKSTTRQLLDIGQGIIGKKGRVESFDWSPEQKKPMVYRQGTKLRVAHIKNEASSDTKNTLRRAVYLGAEAFTEADDKTIESIADPQQKAIATVLDSGRLRNVLTDKYAGDRLLFATEAADAAPHLMESSPAEAITNLLAMNRSLSLDNVSANAMARLLSERDDVRELWGKLTNEGLAQRALDMRTKQEAADLASDLLKFFKENDQEPPPEGEGGGGDGEGDDEEECEGGAPEKGDTAGIGRDGMSYANIGGVLKNEVPFINDVKDVTESDMEPYEVDFWDQTNPSTDRGRYAPSITKMVSENDRIGSELTRLLQIRSAARWEHNQTRGKISPSNLYRVALPTMGNGTWNAQVFRKRKQSDCLDTAVSLLVDCSGSMSGAKFTAACASAVLMGNALDVVHVPFEVTGFTDDGRRAVIPVFKPFEQGWNPSACVTGLSDMGYHLNGNPDAVAVMVARSRLMARKNKRKVMIVLSDGSPASFLTDGHGALKRAVKEAIDAGIEVYGIGINSNAVKSFYPNHKVVGDYSKLSVALLDVLDKHLN